MLRSGDPNRPGRLEHAPAGLEPQDGELVGLLAPAGLVPVALVDRRTPAALAGKPAVGKKIRRIGEDQVEESFGESLHQLEAVAAIERVVGARGVLRALER